MIPTTESTFLTPPHTPYRPNWRSRIFAPLTPIVASPITTPPHSLSKQTLSLNSDDTTALAQNVERAALSTPTWTSIPPTPPPNLISRSKSMSVRPMSSFVSPSASLPDAAAMRRSVLSSSVEMKRRASLPPTTTAKPLPPIPRSSSRPSSDSSHSLPSESVSPPHSLHSTEKPLSTVSPRPRPVFHLAVDLSDREDDSRPDKFINTDSSEPDSAVVAIIPSLPLLHNSPSVGERESFRRYHALLELLSTELGYLLDLRTLVSVYLRLLPVLTNRVSTFAAYGSSSNSSLVRSSRPSVICASHTLSTSHRTRSHPQLNGNVHSATSSSRLESQAPTHVSTYSLHSRGDRSSVRHLFSTADLDAITRNAEDILEFHEMLVRKLRDVASPFGLPMTLGEHHAENSGQSHLQSPQDVHRAINAVSAVFINHASTFDQYQPFCSGHSEAFDLVRKVQQRYPTEWDAFEQRCIVVAAEMHLDASLRISQAEVSEQVDPSVLQTQARRRHSLSSLDGLSNGSAKQMNLSASESGHFDRETNDHRPRLMFMDYLIKPVQRVCRYPLLFDQLQGRIMSQGSSEGSGDSSFTPSDSDQEPVKTALRTMRMVASLVDEARRLQDLSAKSIQIVSRITQGLLTSTASHNRLPQSSSLSTFLSTLPPCRLSGSLDVIHLRGTNMERLGTVKAKYLGGFLFPGGFLVLVKVVKSKVYEPKHWFTLRGFELMDSNDDDGLLPSWFRLSFKGHTFEFVASCRREKDVWVDAIRSAIAEEVPWSEEPPTSLQTLFWGEGSGFLSDDLPFDTITPLPTIKSIPELDNVESALRATGENPSALALAYRTVRRAEFSTKAEITPTVGPSRRSSVASQSIPASDLSTFHLVRSTASAREQVDRSLLDVFSEKCLTARFHAHTHEGELFEAQKVTRSFSRSSSGLNMASAMSVAAKNRLTKRESVLVPRRKSFIDVNSMPNDPENYTYLAKPKPKVRRRPPNGLKITAISKATSYEGDEDTNELYVESPSPMSHCSSVSFATPVTPLTLPPPLSALPAATDDAISRSEFLNVRPKESVPKRSKSMIENFRGLFVPRSTSPTVSLTRESSTRSSVSNSGLLRWWSRESLRRRVRSAPDVPGEDLPSALTTQSLNVSGASRPSLATTDRPYSQPDLQILVPSPSEFGVEDSSPKKNVVSSSRGPRRRWTSSALTSTARDEGSIPARARMRRNLSFFNRFTPVTPSTVSQHSES